MTDEEYVRSVWERAEIATNGTSFTVHVGPRGGMGAVTKLCASESAVWSAAAEFTRNRLEQVRQLREEIEVVRRRKHEDARYLAIVAVWDRILARIESELATLTQGMRPDVQP